MNEDRCLEVTEISAYGGYICRKCGTTFLTKCGWILIPGSVRCSLCDVELHLSERICQSANEARRLVNMVNAFLGLS